MGRLWLTLAFLAVGSMALLGGSATPQEPGPPPAQDAADEAADPQTRGPLHEAFAEPGTTTPEPGPIVPKQPPDPIEEMPPDQKPQGNNVQWISGYWIYDDERADFLWVSGFWRDVPPDRRWVAGYWNQVDAQGWQRVAGYWAPEDQADVEYLPTPPQNIDAGPSVAAPSADAVYAPGLWVYNEQRYLWRPGYWVTALPGWVYVPARYTWTPAGCIYSAGYWDYPLETRGVLFCPVAIDRSVWRPNWVYRPRFVIATDALFTALFARPAFGHYYFGDYFASGYAQEGFIPWTNYSPVRGTYNPLFGYYRAHHDRNWGRDIRQVYVQRSAGLLPPPPSNFRQQTQIMQNITRITNNSIQINDRHYQVGNTKALAQQMRMVAPLTQVATVNTHVRMHPVSPANRTAIQKHVTQIREVAQTRRQFDAKLVAVHAKEPRNVQRLPAARLALPRVAPHFASPPRANAMHARPPMPAAPAPVVVQHPPVREFKTPRLQPHPTVFHPNTPPPPVHPAPVHPAPVHPAPVHPAPVHPAPVHPPALVAPHPAAPPHLAPAPMRPPLATLPHIQPPMPRSVPPPHHGPERKGA